MAVLLAVVAAMSYWQPLFFGCFAGIVVVTTAVLMDQNHCQLRDLAASRPGESICTFARSFDCRSLDTRIIRATYEELQVNYYKGFCPVRADDRFAGELGFVDEDLDEVAAEIARRAGRTLDRCDDNPFRGRVETVADLVHFLMHQPTVDPA